MIWLKAMTSDASGSVPGKAKKTDWRQGKSFELDLGNLTPEQLKQLGGASQDEPVISLKPCRTMLHTRKMPCPKKHSVREVTETRGRAWKNVRSFCLLV